jgi:putative ABC transport system permease protein
MMRWIEYVLADVRIALRGMRVNAVLTLSAIACIGLGIGATATIYSTAAAFTFRPLPQLGDPHRLVVLGESPQGRPVQGTISPATYAALRAETSVFSGIAVMQATSASLRGHEEPERVRAARVNAELFSVLGVTPQLGRAFVPADETEQSRGTIISHGLWQRQFAGDSRVAGRSVYIDGEEHTVVGVAPEGFTFPGGTELWQPLLLDGAAATNAEQRSLQAMARLAPGAGIRQVRARLDAIAVSLERADPAAWDGWELRAEPAEQLFGSGPRPFMISMLVGVAFVMLIVCGNVAMLLLARSATRHRELAIRVALGASRGALLRQCLTESVLLGVFGGIAGVVLSLWGIALIAQSVPPELHTVIVGYNSLRIDARAVAFAMAVSLLAGMVFGLAPAWDATRLRVREWLTHAGADAGVAPRAERLRHTLIVGEIALASALLVTAVLMLQSVIRLAGSDPGFVPARMLTLRVSVPQHGYEADRDVAAFYRQLGEELQQLPEVESVGLVSILPMSFSESRTEVVVEGRTTTRSADAERLQLRIISRDYIGVLGLQLSRGTDFSGLQEDDRRVGLISESAARRLWPDTDPLGRRVRLGADPQWVEIIGVVPDIRHNPLVSSDPQAAVYVPLEQRAPRAMSIVLRTRDADPAAASASVRRAVASVDPRVAAGDMVTMQRTLETATSPQRATAGALFIFAVIAVVLAALGIYGVISFFVSRRAHDMAIRRALGAPASGLLAYVLTHSMRLCAVGLVIGLLGAAGLARALQSILYDTNPSDPLTYVGVAALTGVVVLIASVLPAVRAAAVEPGAVLNR